MMAATWIFSLAVAGVHQLSVDFAVPLMALENVPLGVALRRVWSMAAAQPVDFLVYLLIKAVLLIVVSMALLMVEFLVLIIPIVLLLVVLVMMAKSLAGNPVALVMFVGVATSLFVSLILFLVAMIAAPTYVFFQGYALEFFADRYPRLKAVLHAAPPPVEPPPLLPAM